jgi:hypothetical protein
MTDPCPLPNMDELFIDVLGQSITLRTVTKTLNTRGDSTDSNSDATVTAYIFQVSGGEELHEQGYVNVGDLLVYFKSTQTVTAPAALTDYRVYWNSTWYLVDDVAISDPSGTTLMKLARCKRM